MLDWLRRSFALAGQRETSHAASAAPAPIGTYPIFTTEFDRVVTADQWRDEVAPEGSVQRSMLDRSVALVKNAVRDQIYNIDIAATPNYSRVNQSLDANERSDTIVSVLIDHSGSLRGVQQATVFAAVNAMSRLLNYLHIPYEVLGFTTGSWHGGQSRRKWISEGRREFPGRLCDLLHVIYSDVNDWPLHGDLDLPLLCFQGALKENVDGEAVLWACERLRALPHKRKLLFVISDGAPVDDSTLIANWNGILHDHIIAVVRAIEAEGAIMISGIGVGHDVHPYYSSGSTFLTIDEIGEKVLGFVADRLCEAADWPPRLLLPDETSDAPE